LIPRLVGAPAVLLLPLALKAPCTRGPVGNSRRCVQFHSVLRPSDRFGGLLVVGLLQGGDLAQALLMSSVALLITPLEGSLLTPLLLGKVENVSALTVFIGLMLWTWLWGAWGTILAVRMLVILKSTADHVPGLSRVGRLMAP
jgi:AI-2E family transporter